MIFFVFFFIFIISCKETEAHEQAQIVAKEIRDKHYEERKEEERQFMKSIQNEHEETIEKKIEETEKNEKQREHIPHKKDSTHRKDEEHHHQIPSH